MTSWVADNALGTPHGLGMGIKRGGGDVPLSSPLTTTMKFFHVSALVLVALSGVNSKSWFGSDSPGSFLSLSHILIQHLPDLPRSRLHQVECETVANLA